MSGKAVGFKVIKVFLTRLEPLQSGVCFWSIDLDTSLAEAAKLRLNLRDEYIVRLQRLDAILRQSGHLTQRFRFSYGGLPAIQYSFSANRDFEIIIHAKNILVTEQDFVIIDPY